MKKLYLLLAIGLTSFASIAQSDLMNIIAKEWVLCGNELDWNTIKDMELLKEGEPCDKMKDDPTTITVRFNQNKQLAYSKFSVSELTTTEESGIIGTWKLQEKKKLLKVLIADGKQKYVFQITEMDKKRLVLVKKVK